MEIIISAPGEGDMPLIHQYVQDFMLDDEDLQKEQFLIALHNNTLVGFGRLRNHTDCLELCTLGIIPSFRGKGVGTKIVKALLEKANQEVFAVCIIPDFFEKFNFEITPDYPSSIARKLHICTTVLVVEESYCVMRRL